MYFKRTPNIAEANLCFTMMNSFFHPTNWTVTTSLIFDCLNYAADFLDVVFCHLPLYNPLDGKRWRGRQGLSGLSQALADELAGVLSSFIQSWWKSQWKTWWVIRDHSYWTLALSAPSASLLTTLSSVVWLTCWREGMPFRGTLTGWRGGPAWTAWSSTRPSTGSCTWVGVIPKHR